MKTLPRTGFVMSVALSLGLSGCGQSGDEKSLTAQPTPTPAIKTSSKDDGKDFSAKNIRHKADQAAVVLENFLKDQDPKLRDKVQRLADKVSDKLGKDKEHWREKLEEKRRELQPQIEQLKQQIGQADGNKNKDKLRDVLSKLEGKSQETDKKLAELESAGADAWRQFKAQLKQDEARDGDTPPTDATPSPTPRDR